MGHTTYLLVAWGLNAAIWSNNPCLNPETHLPEEGLTDCPEYNRAALDPITGIVRNIIMSFWVILALICVVSTKYRSAASAFYWVFSIWEVLLFLIPTNTLLELHVFDAMIRRVLYFCCYYSDSGPSIVFSTLTLAVQILIMVWSQHKSTDVLTILTVLSCHFVLCMCFAVLFVYVMSLQNKVEMALSGNEKLLDGMHEGLLILSEEHLKRGGGRTPRVMFSN